MENLTDVTGVLGWLVGGGSVVVVNWFVSWALERADWWHGLASWLKQGIILLIAAVVGVASQWLLLNPEVWAQFEPYIVSVLLGVGGWLASQRAHLDDPERIP